MPNNVTVQELITRIDDQRRDDTDASIDNNKKFRAISAILEIISARSNFKFAIRRARVEYLSGYTDYSLENIVGITDFKEVHELRTEPESGSVIDYVQERNFSHDHGLGRTREQCAIVWRDAVPILRISDCSLNKSKTQLHAMTDFNDNGTWIADTAGSDADNVSDDTVEFENGAVKFEVVPGTGTGSAFGSSIFGTATFGAGPTNRATIYNLTLTPVDLSTYLNVGHHRIKVDLPADVAGHLTSVEIRYGANTTNYYQITTTAPADGGDWQEGRNEIEFDWANANVIGSPDPSSIGFALITFNYATGLTDTEVIRVTDWWVIYPRTLYLYYFSTQLARSEAGVRQEGVTDLTDEILIPRRHKETVVEGVLWQVMDQMGTSNSEDSDKHLKFFEYGTEYDPVKASSKRFGGMRQMMREFGIAVPTEKRKLRVRHIPET